MVSLATARDLDRGDAEGAATLSDSVKDISSEGDAEVAATLSDSIRKYGQEGMWTGRQGFPTALRVLAVGSSKRQGRFPAVSECLVQGKAVLLLLFLRVNIIIIINIIII